MNELQRSKLPFFQMVTVFAIQFSEAMNINVLFPFLAFFVEDLGYGGHVLGYYAGGLAASFCAAQFLSAVVWGAISDRFGRRPAVILGTIGTGFGMLVFGFSRTYTQAIIGRSMSGLLAGNVGVLKSFLNEITDETNRGKGFAMLSLSWSVGTVIAPLVGGLLCKPYDKYAIFHNFPIFKTYPYLLPCLICVICNFTSSIVATLVMQETRKSYHVVKLNESMSPISKNIQYSKVSLPTQLDESIHSIREDEQEISINDDNDNDNDNDNNIELMGSTRDKQSQNNMYAKVNLFNTTPISSSVSPDNKSKDLEGKSQDYLETSLETIDFESTEIDISDMNMSKDNSIFNKENDNEEDDDEYQYKSHILSCCFKNNPIVNKFNIVPSSSSSSSSSSKMRTPIPLFFRKKVVIATSTYGLVCMSYILLDETIPLFLKLDKDLGGISFNSSEIGFLLSSSGFFMIFFTSLILPELASMRKSKLFMISILFAIPAVLAWPSIAVFNYRVISHWSSHNKETLWALLIICASIKNVFACMTFTAVMMQVNDSCPSRYLGAVNGLGQSLGALARAIGPALGGILWSLSQKNHFIFTNFIVCAFLLSLCQLLNCFLPEKNTQNSDSNEEIVFNEMI